MIRLLFGLGIIVVTACSTSVKTEETRTEFATDFIFLLDVPYEVSRHVASGESCSLVLPDGTYLPATIGEPLATVDAVSQTQPVRLYADAPPLPEGMRLKAVIRVNGNEELKMLLPKSAVQSDETLTSYWVMKLIDDSTAVRVPVETGNSTADSMEVCGSLTPADRIVLTGGYALPDSSKIIISHE